MSEYKDKTQSRGFITIATGNEKYFILAQNLLNSYRLFAKIQYPFAILTDKLNEYTNKFDEVIFMKTATGSYMDKLMLLVQCPYDETIFIDADCLAYGDINKYWDYFDSADDFSCFGETYTLDSKNGWFEKEDIGEYKNMVSYIPHLHGGVYFIRKGEMCKHLFELSIKIASNYHQYKFRMFNEPADEPILALSMALCNCHPIKSQPHQLIFIPCARTLKTDIFSGYLSYSTNWHSKISNGLLAHWGNFNTCKAKYIFEVEKLSILVNKTAKLRILDIILYKYKLRLFFLYLYDFYKTVFSIVKKVYAKIRNKI